MTEIWGYINGLLTCFPIIYEEGKTDCMYKLSRYWVRKKNQGRVRKIGEGIERRYGSQAEKAMAPHSSTLAWKIPWTEEPGGLQSMGSQRVRHDWATSLSLSCIGEGNGNPLQCSCLENPMDRGAWGAAVHGITKSQTRLSDWHSMYINSVRPVPLKGSAFQKWCWKWNRKHDEI